MRIVIIGTTGFIGSSLLRCFTENGYDCLGANRSLKTRKLLDSDICLEYDDLDGLISKFKQLKPTHIIHTVGVAHDRHKPSNHKLYFDVNVGIASQVALAARCAGVARFIYLSSSKVYGNLVGTGCPDEGSIGDNLDIYGHTKLIGERSVIDILNNSNTSAMIVRLPLVYGKGVKGNLEKMTKLLSKGYPLLLTKVKSNKRSMLSIGNLFLFLQKSMNYELRQSEVINIKDEYDYSTS